jgi:hypothetical protein
MVDRIKRHRENRSLSIDADNPFPMESSDPVHTAEEPNTLNALPTELLEIISEFLTIEPDVTTNDQTVQRRQNLPKFCLVSKKFYSIAKPNLYKIVHISTDTRLRLFLRTVGSRTGPAKLIKKVFLSVELCGENVSGPENHNFCLDMCRVLDCTTELQLLSLDLKECDCCFRNTDPGDIAANGVNSKSQPANSISLEALSLSRRQVSPRNAIV